MIDPVTLPHIVVSITTSIKSCFQRYQPLVQLSQNYQTPIFTPQERKRIDTWNLSLTEMKTEFLSYKRQTKQRLHPRNHSITTKP